MKEILALIVFLNIFIITIYCAATKIFDPKTTIVALIVAVVAGFIVAKLPDVKKIKLSKDGTEIELFEKEVDKITNEALTKIENKVELHKIELDRLIATSQNIKEEIKELNDSTLKYAFFIVDPFTGIASTGGGHAESTAWSTTTDLSSLIIEAKAKIDSNQFGLAFDTVQKIEKTFPNYPGIIYIKFLIYKKRAQEQKALEKANELISIISKFNFTFDKNDKIVDVYKYVINWNLSNDRKKEASKIAKKALKYWPDEGEIKNAIQ